MGSLAARAVTLAKFSPSRPLANVLHRSNRQEVTITAFEPFQELTTWPLDSDVMLIVLEGTADVRIGDHAVTVSPGDICLMPARTRGAIRARGGQLIVLRSTTPPAVVDQLVTTSWRPEDHPVPLHEVSDLLRRELARIPEIVRELRGLARGAAELPEAALRDRITSLTKAQMTDLTRLLELEQMVVAPVVERFRADHEGPAASGAHDSDAIATAVRQLDALCAAPLPNGGPGRLRELLIELGDLLERPLRASGSYLSVFDMVQPDRGDIALWA